MKKTRCTITVQEYYGVEPTDDDIIRLLNKLHKETNSWRVVASMPMLNQISHVTHSAYANRRRSIVNVEHRLVYGLPALVTTTPCPTCGAAHNYDCGHKKTVRKSGSGRKRSPRIEISLSDPEKARERLEKALKELENENEKSKV